jgi:hypothetical protein
MAAKHVWAVELAEDRSTYTCLNCGTSIMVTDESFDNDELFAQAYRWMAETACLPKSSIPLPPEAS